MRFNMVYTIFKKEFDDVIRSKYVLGSMIGMPLLIAILVPISMLIVFVIEPEAFIDDPLPFIETIQFTTNWSSLSTIDQSFIAFVELNNIFYLLLPLILPTIIAADSMAGEKDRGTAEGLVAAPVTDSEIYFGKVAGALIPTTIIVWLTGIIYIIVTNIMSKQVLDFFYLPNFRFTLNFLVIGPMLGFASTNVMIWVSTRTSTSRDAQQMGSFLVLPLSLLLLNSIFLALFSNILAIIITIGIIASIDFVLAGLGVEILNRERWLSNV